MKESEVKVLIQRLFSIFMKDTKIKILRNRPGQYELKVLDTRKIFQCYHTHIFKSHNKYTPYKHFKKGRSCA
jgi:hypothetical protein